MTDDWRTLFEALDDHGHNGWRDCKPVPGPDRNEWLVLSVVKDYDEVDHWLMDLETLGGE